MSDAKTPTAKETIAKMTPEKRAELQEALDEHKDDTGEKHVVAAPEEPSMGRMSIEEYRSHCLKKFGFFPNV